MSPTLAAALEGAAKIAFVWACVLGALLPNLIWVERRMAGLIQDRPARTAWGPSGCFRPSRTS